MSLCGLNARMRDRIGMAAVVAGLLLFQIDGLKAVDASPYVAPLHFVQGLCLGVGLTSLIAGLLRRRREG